MLLGFAERSLASALTLLSPFPHEGQRVPGEQGSQGQVSCEVGDARCGMPGVGCQVWDAREPRTTEQGAASSVAVNPGREGWRAQESGDCRRKGWT